MAQKTKLRTVDKKGRITLGIEYAGKNVLIHKSKNSKSQICKIVFIPEQEAWLYKNEIAFQSVMFGLSQAKAGLFSNEDFNTNEDMSWVDLLED